MALTKGRQQGGIITPPTLKFWFVMGSTKGGQRGVTILHPPLRFWFFNAVNQGRTGLLFPPPLLRLWFFNGVIQGRTWGVIFAPHPSWDFDYLMASTNGGQKGGYPYPWPPWDFDAEIVPNLINRMHHFFKLFEGIMIYRYYNLLDLRHNIWVFWQLLRFQTVNLMNRNCEDKKANGRKGKMLRLMATCHPSLSLQGCWVLITINTMKYNYIIMLAEKVN